MNAPSPFAASAMVFAGGGAGAVLRYQVGRWLTALLGPGAVAAFPWATLTVNVSGSLAMGLLAGWLARFGSGGEQWRLLVGVGLLGGFTTFSTYVVEILDRLAAGAVGTALAFLGGTVLAALVATWVGLAVTRTAVQSARRQRATLGVAVASRAAPASTPAKNASTPWPAGSPQSPVANGACPAASRLRMPSDIGRARLRAKIEPDPERPEIILTVRGVGYKAGTG